MKLSLSFGRRLWLLALLFIVGLVLAGGLSALLALVVKENQTAAVRMAAVCQNLMAFVLPSVAVALLCTRLPAELLLIRRGPGAKRLLLALGVTVVSVPAVNCLVELFAMLPWPPAVLEAEAMAEGAVAQLLGPDNVANLLVSILIVGVLTGLGEELFFRGALQRLLLSRPMGLHAAVWITAALFSLMHGQLVGFVPRMLLGASFGYMAAWTASTWTAIAAHALNNSLVVLIMWLGVETDFVGLATPGVSALSALLTAAGLWLLWRSRGARS